MDVEEKLCESVEWNDVTKNGDISHSRKWFNKRLRAWECLKDCHLFKKDTSAAVVNVLKIYRKMSRFKFTHIVNLTVAPCIS